MNIPKFGGIVFHQGVKSDPESLRRYTGTFIGNTILKDFPNGVLQITGKDDIDTFEQAVKIQKMNGNQKPEETVAEAFVERAVVIEGPPSSIKAL